MSDSVINISVGIPVYGVEKYIERCARSLFEQTIDKGIEFIFVNDCTKDRSIEILEQVLGEYPHRKNQTKIIHASQNGGSATTRNIALTHASGKYMIFCDSDDWVEPDMYSTLLSEAEATDADMTICGFYWEYPGKKVKATVPILETSYDYVEHMLASDIHCSTCNNLIKRELYNHAKISFPDGINMWEDVNVIIPLTYHCNKIAVIDRQLYHYEQSNVESYTKRITPQSLENIKQTVEKLDIFVNRTNNPRLKRAFNYFKLTARLNILLSSDNRELWHFSNLFPEANRYIMSYNALSTYWKAGLWLASKKQIWLFRLMMCLKNYIA